MAAHHPLRAAEFTVGFRLLAEALGEILNSLLQMIITVGIGNRHRHRTEAAGLACAEGVDLL